MCYACSRNAIAIIKKDKFVVVCFFIGPLRGFAIDFLHCDDGDTNNLRWYAAAAAEGKREFPFLRSASAASEWLQQMHLSFLRARSNEFIFYYDLLSLVTLTTAHIKIMRSRLQQMHMRWFNCGGAATAPIQKIF